MLGYCECSFCHKYPCECEVEEEQTTPMTNKELAERELAERIHLLYHGEYQEVSKKHTAMIDKVQSILSEYQEEAVAWGVQKLQLTGQKMNMKDGRFTSSPLQEVWRAIMKDKWHKNCSDEFGTFKNQVPMSINRRVEYIDPCIADIVAALNAGGIRTIASCCGHGIKDGEIELNDYRRLVIVNKQRIYESLSTEENSMLENQSQTLKVHSVAFTQDELLKVIGSLLLCYKQETDMEVKTVLEATYKTICKQTNKDFGSMQDAISKYIVSASIRDMRESDNE